jgi:glutamyl-tRNA reductase
MWASLVLLHSHKADRNREPVEGLVDWHTCMRSVYIGDQRLLSISAFYSLSEYEVYTGYKAYALLLEIVSGVHSKLFGESEIQAQFNERFSKKNLMDTPFGSSLLKLKNQILENVKQIRSEFMKGKGRLTYGGVADSLLPKEIQVAVYGTGQLAESMMVHLLKKNRKVIVVGRNAERLEFLKNTYPISVAHLHEFVPQDHSLVLASPHFPIEAAKQLSLHSMILDFRGESDLQSESLPGVKYYSFQYILDKIQETKDNEKHLKPIVSSRIQELTQERENEVLQIPNGWEDIHWLN